MQIPTSPNPITPAPVKKKNFLPFVALGFIIIVVVGVLLLKVFTSQPKPQTQSVVALKPSPTPDPTANWKTYQGDGFTFKYPNIWQPKVTGTTVNFFAIGKPQIDPGANNGGNSLMMISTDSNAGITALTWKNLHDKTMYLHIQETMIAGKKAVKTNNFTIIFFGMPDDKTVTFLIDGSLRDPILSTFKFTDQAQSIDMTTWKTYTNTKDGFTFTYPPDWFFGKGQNIDCFASDQKYIDFYCNGKTSLQVSTIGFKSTQIGIDTYNNPLPKEISQKEALKLDIGRSPLPFISEQFLNINGIPTYKALRQLKTTVLRTDVEYTFLNTKSNRLYRLWFEIDSNKPEDYFVTFDKVANTFKFTQ